MIAHTTLLAVKELSISEFPCKRSDIGRIHMRGLNVFLNSYLVLNIFLNQFENLKDQECKLTKESKGFLFAIKCVPSTYSMTSIV